MKLLLIAALIGFAVASEDCLQCVDTMNKVKGTLDVDQIEDKIQAVCELLPSGFSVPCKVAVAAFTTKYVKDFMQKDAQTVCTDLNFCGPRKTYAPAKYDDPTASSVKCHVCIIGTHMAGSAAYEQGVQDAAKDLMMFTCSKAQNPRACQFFLPDLAVLFLKWASDLSSPNMMCEEWIKACP